MESSIAVFLKRWTASELPPTFLQAGNTGACPETKHSSFHAAQGFPSLGDMCSIELAQERFPCTHEAHDPHFTYYPQ